MKRAYCLIAISLLAISAYGQEIVAMTYNIRYATPNDGPDQWENRKEMLTDQVNFYAPHVLGVQEATKPQMNYLADNLDGYQYIGVGRDDGKDGGEYSAIFFKKELDTLQQGTFWLSETPTQPSKDWDAAYPRVCTYGQFSYQKNTFWVFNTHFDHIGEKARFESARLIMRQVNRLNTNNDPVIIMGDLNATSDQPPIQEFLNSYQDSFSSAELQFGPETTFSGFRIEPDANKRIDYIFHSENIKTQKTAILSQLINQHYPSDHFPVISYFLLEN